MAAQLGNTELQRFLEEAVAAGRFPSVEAAIEAAVTQMKWEEENLPPMDEETQIAVDRADEQYVRGEFHTVEEVRAHFTAKARPQAQPS